MKLEPSKRTLLSLHNPSGMTLQENGRSSEKAVRKGLRPETSYRPDKDQKKWKQYQQNRFLYLGAGQIQERRAPKTCDKGKNQDSDKYYALPHAVLSPLAHGAEQLSFSASPDGP